MSSPAQTVLSILEEFAEDWGLSDLTIGPDTMLKADMGFESTDTMQLFSAIQEALPQVKFRFQELVLVNGKFVPDLSVRAVSTFVEAALQSEGVN